MYDSNVHGVSTMRRHISHTLHIDECGCFQVSRLIATMHISWAFIYTLSSVDRYACTWYPATLNHQRIHLSVHACMKASLSFAPGLVPAGVLVIEWHQAQAGRMRRGIQWGGNGEMLVPLHNTCVIYPPCTQHLEKTWKTHKISKPLKFISVSLFDYTERSPRHDPKAH
jgi:hypothetical protein